MTFLPSRAGFPPHFLKIVVEVITSTTIKRNVQPRMLEHLSCLRGKGEAYEELRKRMIDVCCLHEVRWGGQSAGDEREEI